MLLNNLFSLTFQAILESEPFSITLKTVGKAKVLGEQFAKEVGCKDLDCLSKKVRSHAKLKSVHHSACVIDC